MEKRHSSSSDHLPFLRPHYLTYYLALCRSSPLVDGHEECAQVNPLSSVARLSQIRTSDVVTWLRAAAQSPKATFPSTESSLHNENENRLFHYFVS